MKSRTLFLRLLIILTVGLLITYLTPKVISGSTLVSSKTELKSLHQELGKPLPGEWLSIVKEPGQTFEEYSKSKPNGKTNSRNKIYIRPIGGFSPTDKKALESASEYLAIFYGLPVEILDSISIKRIPDSSIRIHQNKRQANASFILKDLLAPNIPSDAAAYLAFTKIDLFNDAKKNFVFGLGNLVNRSGVYSMARFGNPDKSDLDNVKFVSRILKVASHELGHIFGIKHCINFECIMNGSNSLTESDSKPVYLCPIDLKKVCWNLEMEEVERFNKLNMFWANKGFEENSSFYRKSETLFNLNIRE